MKSLQIITRATVMALLLLAMLLAGVPSAGRTHAAPPVGASPVAVAVAEAVSPATGHLFVVSSYVNLDRETVDRSWVSMLDTRTSRLLRAITIPMAGGQATIVVDAHAGYAYINELGQLDQATNSVFANNVMMLDTHTGAIARTVQLPQPHEAGAVS